MKGKSYLCVLMEQILDRHIKFLKGVGDQRAKHLINELKIRTFGDLLYYFPFKYTDRTTFHRIKDLHGDMSHVQIKGQIKRFRLMGSGRKKRLVAHFSDGESSMELIWFQGIQWIKNNYKSNVDYIIFGKPNVFNQSINIAHPEIELPSQQDQRFNARLMPEYHTTEKLKKQYINSRAIMKLQVNLLQTLQKRMAESLPDALISQYCFMPLSDALTNIHFPRDNRHLQQARYRLKFDELFFAQINVLRLRGEHQERYKGHIFTQVGELFNRFYKEYLPFELTNAQKRVIKEIRRDVGSGMHMNRLLQGDVGSGKTLVALMCLLLAIDNGYQTCLMAPTEILANQHFESINEMLGDLSVSVRLLTGSTRKKQREIIHDELLNGQLQLLIGTHALIEDTVQFQNLGFVVIDEQHRFGVAQRAKLWKKNTLPPHVLVMTATPIPRTLAMTIYGDLDVSVIDELPPGRKPVQTYHAYDSQRLRVFNFLRQQIKAGRQIYIVYPLIKESEKLDYKDLEDGYQSIVRAFPPPDYAVSILHGQMRPEEKEKAMQLFVKGQTHIMVATTVIEVGVNVPNATVMLIESAEKFGLSQLHQLRGRVGRGADQSHCILMTPFKLSADARKRLKAMASTTDGFKIADLDLRLRGPGDLTGTQQSGLGFDFRLANLIDDEPILRLARQTAQDILAQDKKLKKAENQPIVNHLHRLTRDRHDWRDIS